MFAAYRSSSLHLSLSCLTRHNTYCIPESFEKGFTTALVTIRSPAINRHCFAFSLVDWRMEQYKKDLHTVIIPLYRKS